MIGETTYIDFDFITSEIMPVIGEDYNIDPLAVNFEKNFVSHSVAMMHIRRMPNLISLEKSPQAPIWAKLLNRPGIRSVLGLRTAVDQPLVQDTLATLSRDKTLDLLVFFIVFDQSDLDALSRAQAWANWARNSGWGFIIGACKSVGRQTPAPETEHFDFFYVADGDECLLHAPGLILEQSHSFIAYDFSDLRSIWTGRRGQVWNIPADILSIDRVLNEWRDTCGKIGLPNCILRYYGPDGLEVVSALADFLSEALQPNDSLYSAWQHQNSQENARLDVCLMNGPARIG